MKTRLSNHYNSTCGDFLVRVPPPYGYSLPSSKLAYVHLLD